MEIKKTIIKGEKYMSPTRLYMSDAQAFDLFKEIVAHDPEAVFAYYSNATNELCQLSFSKEKKVVKKKERTLLQYLEKISKDLEDHGV